MVLDPIKMNITSRNNLHDRCTEWAFLVAPMAKNLPAMRETWVPSLGWEDSLEEGMATHSNILA